MTAARRRLVLPARIVGLLVATAVAVMAATSIAAAASPRAASASARPAHLTVGVEVLRFAAAGRQLNATGLVTATLIDNSGHVRTIRSRVALTAGAGGGCRVLHLFLNQLNLQLLGLNAHLDKVQLDVTGNPRGGVLGSLFCRLARAKVASGRAAAARALTASVRRNDGQALRFTA